MREQLLSRTETNALRGLAIIGIILHNYCHFLSFAVKENEYTFDVTRPQQMMEMLMSFDKDLFIHIFSFFGHYGVPVFLFASGFGLVMKYEKSKSQGEVAVLPFMTYHYLKLFRLMILGFVTFIIVYILRHDDGAVVYAFDRVISQLTMVINFVYDKPQKIIKPGPYWYFGLMVQLYLLYRLVCYRRRQPSVIIVMIFAALFIQYLCRDNHDTLNYVRYNFIGGVLPFGMGILYARHGKELSVVGNIAIVIISAVVVLFGSMSFLSWLIVPCFIVTGAVATVQLLPARLLNPWVWIGTVSAALFVMHPVMREVIISHYRRVDIYFGIWTYLLSSVALAMLLQYVLRWIPSPKMKKEQTQQPRNEVLNNEDR